MSGGWGGNLDTVLCSDVLCLMNFMDMGSGGNAQIFFFARVLAEKVRVGRGEERQSPPGLHLYFLCLINIRDGSFWKKQ